MTKEKLDELHKCLLEKLFQIANAGNVPGRLVKLEEIHKRLNAVERCLEALKAK